MAYPDDATVRDRPPHHSIARQFKVAHYRKVHPPELPEGVMYAYGFSERRVDGYRIVGHNGGAPGMNAQLDMHLDTGYTVVVLANRDPQIAQEWARYISLRLP